MQAREGQPRALMHEARAAVYALGHDGGVTLWTPEASALFGWSKEEVVGRALPIVSTAAAEEEALLRAEVLAGGWIAPRETRRTRKDGIEVSVVLSAAPIAGNGSDVAGAVFFVEPIPSSGQASAAAADPDLLAEATEMLSSSLDYRVTLRRLADLIVSDLSDWCRIEMLEADGAVETVALAHSDPEKLAAARDLERRYPMDPEASPGPAHVIRTGQTEFHGEIEDELLVETARDETHLAMLRALGLSSAVIVPLTARGRTLGAITLMGEGQRRFHRDDVALAEELARRAALAVDNARLFAAERAARQQVERLQSLTAALAETLTIEQVGSFISEQAIPAIGASAGALLLLRAGGHELDIVASSGYPPDTLERYGHIPVSTQLPAAECVRSRESIWLERLDEAVARFPLVGEVSERRGEAFAAVPLFIGRRTLGALALSFAEPRTFSADERRVIVALADQCAQALERARLYQREQAARARAEQAGERLQRLQEILEIGLSNLALGDLLRELLDRVKRLVEADTAAILLVDDENDAKLRVEASVGVGHEIFAEVAVAVGEGLVGKVAATGRPVVVDDVRGEKAALPHLWRVARSFVGVPLVTEEGVTGVLQLTTTEQRTFTHNEVALLQAVAARAALAIERARLYGREHEIAETLQRSMLPQEMPDVPGIEIVARYVPGGSGLAVGGDWYDAIELPEGRIGIAVGDIVGKGLRAATEMVRLRNAFRAYALEGITPAEVLERLNGLVERQGDGQYSTVVYALYEPRSSTVRFASAGHPPPLVRRPDGSVAFLEGGRSLPLGVAPELKCEQAETELPTGSALVLYTDGLVERRDAGIAEGLQRLAESVRQGPAELDQLIDTLVRERTSEPGLEDDIGIVALCPLALPSHLSLGLPAQPESLRHLRRELRDWLERIGVPRDEVESITCACNEACTNAIEHPLDPRSQLIRLEADVVDGRLSITVRDSGRWRTREQQRDRGIGLRLMRELMDLVEVNRSPEGTEVRMTRTIAQSPLLS